MGKQIRQHRKTKARPLSREQRELRNRLLSHLVDIDRRKIWREKGYKSIGEYLKKRLWIDEVDAGDMLTELRHLQRLSAIEESKTPGSA